MEKLVGEVVWKMEFPLENIQDKMVFPCPTGAKIISVGLQRDNVCVWFRCNPENKRTHHMIRFAGTGHIWAEPLGDFISTLIFHNGLVLHAFDLGEILETVDRAS